MRRTFRRASSTHMTNHLPDASEHATSSVAVGTDRFDLNDDIFPPRFWRKAAHAEVRVAQLGPSSMCVAGNL
jgi:hypothetical protein